MRASGCNLGHSITGETIKTSVGGSQQAPLEGCANQRFLLNRTLIAGYTLALSLLAVSSCEPKSEKRRT
jgi:hypothetical protein